MADANFRPADPEQAWSAMVVFGSLLALEERRRQRELQEQPKPDKQDKPDGAA